MQILGQPKNKIEGLKGYHISLETKVLTLNFASEDDVPPDLKHKLEDLLVAYDPQSLVDVTPPEAYLRKGLLGLCMGLGFVLMMVFGWHIPFIAMTALIAAGVITSLYLGFKSSNMAVQKFFKTGALTMDLLFMISASAAIVMTLAHLFVPAIPMMIDVALLIFAFRLIGLGIEHRIRQKISDRVKFEEMLSTHYDVIKPDGSIHEIPREDLTPGMVIRLKPGQMLPLDGNSVTSGMLDANNITGATRFIVREGQPLRSGVFLHQNDKPIDIKLMQDKEHSFIYQYEHILDSHQQIKPQIEQRADKIMRYFLPTVIFIAALAGAVTSLFFPWVTAIKTALYLLVSACPCIFGMITPLALYVGMMKSSTQAGVTFDSRVSFEKAADINAVVFDISGTLTENKLTLIDCTVPANYFPLIAALEKDAKHIVGAFIHQYASDHAMYIPKIEKQLICHDDKRGISAKLGEDTYLIGNSDFLKARGIIAPAADVPRTYFVENGVIIGQFDIADELRHDAKDTIASLNAMGVDIYLCTGMSADDARYYSNKLGIDQSHVFSACLPQDKVRQINELNKTKVTLYAGDGGNDKGALQVAHVGLAVTSNTFVRQEAGALLNDVSKLIAIPAALMHAKRTLRHINHNLIFSLSYNIASMVFACLAVVYFPQYLNPAMGAAIMFIQTAMVLGNTLKYKLSDVSVACPPVGVVNKTSTVLALAPEEGDDPFRVSFSTLHHLYRPPNMDPCSDEPSLAFKPDSRFNNALN